MRVIEGEWARGGHSPWGDGSPGSREAEGEGGEGFNIAQSGRRADLRVSPEREKELTKVGADIIK